MRWSVMYILLFPPCRPLKKTSAVLPATGYNLPSILPKTDNSSNTGGSFTTLSLIRIISQHVQISAPRRIGSTIHRSSSSRCSHYQTKTEDNRTTTSIQAGYHHRQCDPTLHRQRFVRFRSHRKSCVLDMSRYNGIQRHFARRCPSYCRQYRGLDRSDSHGTFDLQQRQYRRSGFVRQQLHSLDVRHESDESPAAVGQPQKNESMMQSLCGISDSRLDTFPLCPTSVLQMECAAMDPAGSNGPTNHPSSPSPAPNPPWAIHSSPR